jgi:hypothetical protein
MEAEALVEGQGFGVGMRYAYHFGGGAHGVQPGQGAADEFGADAASAKGFFHVEGIYLSASLGGDGAEAVGDVGCLGDVDEFDTNFAVG